MDRRRAGEVPWHPIRIRRIRAPWFCATQRGCPRWRGWTIRRHNLRFWIQRCCRHGSSRRRTHHPKCAGTITFGHVGIGSGRRLCIPPSMQGLSQVFWMTHQQGDLGQRATALGVIQSLRWQSAFPLVRVSHFLRHCRTVAGEELPARSVPQKVRNSNLERIKAASGPGSMNPVVERIPSPGRRPQHGCYQFFHRFAR